MIYYEYRCPLCGSPLFDMGNSVYECEECMKKWRVIVKIEEVKE